MYKKAGAPIDEMIPTMILIFALVAGVVLFKIISVNSESSIQEQISNYKFFFQANNNLISFLNQEYEDKNVADLIVKSKLSGDYANLQTEIKNFFTSKYSNDWIIEIENSEGENLISSNPNGVVTRTAISSTTSRKLASTAIIPEPGDYIKIKLYLIELRDQTFIT